jgi:hypothetical protein
MQCKRRVDLCRSTRIEGDVQGEQCDHVLMKSLYLVTVFSLSVACTNDDSTCADCESGGSGGATNGNGPGPGSGAGGPTGSGGGGATSGVGGGVEGTWVPLITADWQLDPGSEKTRDTYNKVIDRDMYIGAIRPISPTGTHHSLLGINSVGLGNVIYASGVGTNALVFPKGVGLKVKQGESVVIELHLFNPSPNPLSGTSGIEVIEVPAAEVVDEADVLLAGPLSLSIPPNQMSTHTSTCSIGVSQKIFAIFPHMHQLGSHLKSTLTINGSPSVIHDAAYDFNHQPFVSMTPIAVNPGDSVKTECTFNNTTNQTVGWGESSTSEMCFSILYRFPAQGGSICPG